MLLLLCIITQITNYIYSKKTDIITKLNIIILPILIILLIIFPQFQMWLAIIYALIWLIGFLPYYILKNFKPKNYKFKKNGKIFTYFSPQDKRWKDINYGVSTIGGTGCGLGVLSMIESIKNPETNPQKVRDWIVNKYPDIKGGTPPDVMQDYLKYIGFEYNMLNKSCDIKSELKNNNIICVLYRTDKWNSHYVILYDIKFGRAQIADPANFLRIITGVNLNTLLLKVEDEFPYISVKI